jgi:NADH-quinone oxidoreductase B subunit
MVVKGIFRLKDRMLNYAAVRSPWVLHMDTGGCNGCSIELFAVLNPRFDIERFGGVSKANPRHTDILLIDGAVTRKIAPVLKRIYEQTPEPKAVIAVGACAISKGIFHDSYNIVGPLDRIMPVDVYVPGCPPRPDAILHGVVSALQIWRERI